MSRVVAIRGVWALGGVCILGLCAPAGAQPAPAGAAARGDPLMLMNRAMFEYNQGFTDQGYEKSIETLTALLKVAPDDRPARVLRALAYGQLAAAAERQARERRSEANRLRRQLDQLEQERRAGQDLSAGARKEIQGKITQLTDKLAELTGQAREQDRSAVGRYVPMRDDLNYLLGTQLTDRDAVVRLLDGVAEIKLAGYATLDAVTPQTRDQRRRFLQQAAGALERYLTPPEGSDIAAPVGLNRVRAEFFLAVVLYRLAFEPGASRDAPQSLRDPAKLAEAARRFEEQASDERMGELLPADTPNREREIHKWTSYPNLYLGLIHTSQRNRAVRRRNAAAAGQHLEQATHYFEEARKRDAFPKKGDSLSGKVIPEIVSSQSEEFDRIKERPAVSDRGQDFMLEWSSGFARDTNVILLGDDTSAPPDIGRRRDVAFKTGVGLRYTLDLGAVDPRLDRWTVGLLGRSAANWHGDIREFNEQDYGASVALMYELLRPWDGAGGRQQGPLYAGIQYDYDYFLLGNNGFLRSNRVAPRFTLYTYDQHLVSTLGFAYEDRNYLETLTDTRFDRDGNYFTFELGQSFEVRDMTEFYGDRGWEPWGREGDPGPDDPGYSRWLRPFIGAEYGWDSTVGREFDARHFLLAAGVDLPLPWGVDFDIGAEWEWQNYQGGSLIDFHRRGREDFVQTYSFGLERRFVIERGDLASQRELKFGRLLMIIRGDVRLTDDDSNVEDRLGQEIFQYTRAIYGLTVTFQFN